jgi:hypothetical protein
MEKARARDHPGTLVLDDDGAVRIQILINLAKDPAILGTALENGMPETLAIPRVRGQEDQFGDGIEIGRLH